VRLGREDGRGCCFAVFGVATVYGSSLSIRHQVKLSSPLSHAFDLILTQFQPHFNLTSLRPVPNLNRASRIPTTRLFLANQRASRLQMSSKTRAGPF
jgi:hypothetical protein